MYYTYAHYTADKSRLFYIGKGKKNRMNEIGGRSQYWQNIVKKHGLHVELLANWKTEQEAFQHEMFLIECFRDLSKICNLTDGGEGCSGYSWTEAQKEKLKGKLPHNTGKKWNEDVKIKISQAQKGRKIGPQAKIHSKKIGIALKGKEKSLEHIQKMSKNGKLQGKILRVCPHCKHENYGVNIFRWHFDNCKEKQ